MGRRDRIRRDSGADDGSGAKMVLLIVGLALGIPTLIGVLVLCVLFGLSYFVFKKTKEAAVELVDRAEKNQDDFRVRIQQQQQEAREAARKAQQEGAERAQKAQEEAAIRQKEFMEKFNNKDKQEPKFVPVLGPLAKVPGTNMGDLMSVIDPKKDGGGRRWEMIGNELHCKDIGGLPRIEIPYQPPAEYDFIASFSQPNLRNGISLIMPNPNGGSFFFYLGGVRFGAPVGTANCGFAAKPKNFDKEFPNLIQVNTKYAVTVQVRRDSVRALLDGKELMNLQTDYRNLITDGWRSLRDPKVLAIACDDPTVFYQVRIVEINGVGKRLR